MPNYSFEFVTTSGSRYTFIWDTNCNILRLRSARFNGIVKSFSIGDDDRATISFVSEDCLNMKLVTFVTSTIGRTIYF